tara:strand:- start:1342 stop:1662 length:321 start_codon:yes stop_codon:yes gene_type:complete
MNSSEYLEMANQLKTKFEENEKLVNRIIENNVDLKKKIMVAYSLIRIIDSGEFIDSSDAQVFIEMLRAHLSKIVEMDIIRCECGVLRLPPILEIVNLNDLDASSAE